MGQIKIKLSQLKLRLQYMNYHVTGHSPGETTELSLTLHLYRHKHQQKQQKHESTVLLEAPQIVLCVYARWFGCRLRLFG